MAQTEVPVHGKTFPGETEEYRRARDDLLRAEIDLRAQTEAVASQRRGLPLGGAVPTDYTFEVWDDRAHAGWKHARLLSSAHTTYRTDYNAEASDGAQLPMATVFVRRDSQIRLFWSSELFFVQPEPGQHPRHVDFMWPLWAVLDRTPDGRDPNWTPQLTN
jgi:predicted dithiol-disulfide oxidoreductase (DUF899 family)